MTANEINRAKAEEEARHNRVVEQQSEFMNFANVEHLQKSDAYTSKHYATQDAINKEHYERSDAINQAHYERSDAAGLMQAEAAKTNAAANYGNYEMQHDIEYGWTGSDVFPSGMPLSAQVKTMQGYQIQADIGLKEEQTKTEKAKQAYNLTSAFGNAAKGLNQLGQFENRIADIFRD